MCLLNMLKFMFFIFPRFIVRASICIAKLALANWMSWIMIDGTVFTPIKSSICFCGVTFFICKIYYFRFATLFCNRLFGKMFIKILWNSFSIYILFEICKVKIKLFAAFWDVLYWVYFLLLFFRKSSIKEIFLKFWMLTLNIIKLKAILA